MTRSGVGLLTGLAFELVIVTPLITMLGSLSSEPFGWLVPPKSTRPMGVHIAIESLHFKTVQMSTVDSMTMWPPNTSTIGGRCTDLAVPWGRTSRAPYSNWHVRTARTRCPHQFPSEHYPFVRDKRLPAFLVSSLIGLRGIPSESSLEWAIYLIATSHRNRQISMGPLFRRRCRHFESYIPDYR